MLISPLQVLSSVPHNDVRQKQLDCIGQVCVCVCVYVCVHVVCVCMCTYMYMYMYLCMCTPYTCMCGGASQFGN